MKIIRKKTILLCLLLFSLQFIPLAFSEEKNLVAVYTTLDKLKKSLIADEEYNKAIEFLKEFANNHADTYFAQMASIEIADIYFKYLKDHHKALGYYIKVIKATDNPDLKRTILEKVVQVQKAITAMELDILSLLLDNYYLTNLEYPKELAALNHKDQNVLTDSWGEAYYYRPSNVDFLPGLLNQQYLLFSKGKDKQEGTLDDIVPASAKLVTPKEEDKTSKIYPFKVKNVFQSEGILKGVVSSSLKMHKYQTVQEGDLVDNNIILGIKPEGIIIYTAEKKALLIPIGE